MSIKIIDNLTKTENYEDKTFEPFLIPDTSKPGPGFFTLTNTGFTTGLGKLVNLFYKCLFTRKGNYKPNPNIGSMFPDFIHLPIDSYSAVNTFLTRTFTDIELTIKDIQKTGKVSDSNELLSSIEFWTEIDTDIINIYVKLITEEGQTQELLVDENILKYFTEVKGV